MRTGRMVDDPPRRREWVWRWAALPVAAVLLAVGLAACSSVRSDLGTTNGPCYVALPAASAAVHGQGHLAGVRLVTVSSLRHVPVIYPVAATMRAGRRVTHVCLVAFTGHFTSGTVDEPHGRPMGHLAVVVLEYQGNELLGTVVFAHPPLRFGHTHLGL
jgi:hypothetical protein